MFDVLMVRHGESVWNAEGRWQGRADPALSVLGEAQAIAAAAVIPDVDVMVSSTLRRAVRTAEIIAGLTDLGDVHLEPDFVERDAGEWSGLTRTEIDTAWPGYLSSGRRPPRYEADAHLLERVVGGIKRLVERFGPAGSAIAVCHGGVIYAIEQHLSGSFDRIPNLGGRWVHVSSDGLLLGERVVLVDPEALTVQVPDLL